MTTTPDSALGYSTPSPDLEEMARTLLSELEKVPREQRRISRKRRRFEKQLSKRWRTPLRLLERFVLIAAETGASFEREHRDEAEISGDPVVEVMIRSHARACQTASAILTLLKAGYADDAVARWRSLHELWVVTSFIRDNGQEVAERYRQHLKIEQYKIARMHQNAADQFGDQPVPVKVLNELRAERDRLVAKFGPDFEKNYGWAADAMKIKSPNFSQIAARVSLDHWRPNYEVASQNVHAAAHGSYYRLGSDLHAHPLLLAGPSESGLVGPGHWTAIALGAITTNLLETRPSPVGKMITKVLHDLQEDTREAFLRAQRRLEVIASRNADS